MAAEQWRDLVEKYFRPEDVPLALWVMDHESSGNPNAVGDGGDSIGLYQLNKNGLGAGMSVAERKNPEANIAKAAQAVYGGSGWDPWGASSAQYNHKYDPSTGTGYFGAIGYGIKNGTMPQHLAKQATGDLVHREGDPTMGDRENPVHREGDPTMSDKTPLTDENGNTVRFTDPTVNDQYQQILEATQQAIDAWIQSGQEAFSPQYYNMMQALEVKDTFESSNSHLMVEPNNGEDPAQQAFDNSIRLGDLNLREADSAFNKWLQKTESARAAAVNERDQRAGYNQEIVERQQARNESSTPGLMPRARNAGYVEQPFEQMLNRWQEKYGVEDQFDPDSVDFTTPEELPGAGSGAGTGSPGQTPHAVSPDDTTHTPPVGHPAGAPATVGPKGNVPAAGHPASTQPSATPNTPPLEHPAMAGPSSPPDEAWWKSPGSDMVAGLLGSPGEAVSDPRVSGNFIPFIGGTPWADDVATGAVEGAKKAGGAAKDVGSGLKHWWQRGFAEGGMGIKGGPAWVGEKGPEIMEVPDFGRKIVGQQGPEQVNVPEGANIIPLEEAMAFEQIRKAAQQPSPRQNPQRKQQEMMARANDPNLEQKVRESMQKAFASEAATDPPFTPVLEDDPRIKDYWAPWRELSGVPAYASEAMAMQEEAQKGQRGGGQRQQQQRPAQPQQGGR